MLKTNCCWNRWQFRHDKKHEVVHCTSTWLPIFRQSWSFTGFHSNEYPCFEQSIGSNRTAGVSSSNRTVTNRSKLTRLFALSPSWSVPTWGLWTFSAKYPFYLSIRLSCSALCFFSKQIPRYFAVTICLSRGFLKCSVLKNRARRISLMRFAFLDHASKLPFSFPNFSFVPDASWELLVCPAEAFNPNSSSFRRIELTGSESWETQPWTFVFFSHNSNCALSTFFSRPRAEVPSRQHVERRQRMPQMHLFPDL